MMRPATPLSVLFFIAFAFLVLSSLSTPIVKAIPLGTYDGVDFGVFGFCKGAKCSSIALGYSMSNLFTSNNGAGDFSLPTSLRNTVSVALIVHPIAAFLCLICLILAIAAHFHSPSHSARFLLGLFILTIPTLFASLIAFLVDVLLFIPHVAWGGWIVLAATIILLTSSLITCGMRRSLVSRKEQRKRIAENAEMNGENFLENRKAEMATLPKAESPPPSGNTISSSGEKGAVFTSFDLQPVSSTDDRIPLNPNAASARNDSGAGPYDEPGLGGPQGYPGRGPPRDQYGNPLPQGAMGPTMNRQESDNFMGSTPSSRHGGPRPGYGRGRGGYAPPMAGRGGYPPRGGMMRGGPQGMRGPPPPGWSRRGRGMPPGAMMGRGGYQPGPPRGGYYGGPGGGAPDRMMMGGRGPSVDVEGPIGQAVELDERSGLPSPSQSRPSSSPGVGEMPGMVGIMQQPRQLNDRGLVSPTSDYEHPQSPETYVPPRAQWTQKPATPAMLGNRSLSPIEASPTSQRFNSPPRIGVRAPSASDTYVEDIDPQFETDNIAPTIPTSLMPGPPPPDQNINPPPSNAYLQPSDPFPSDSYGSSSDLPSDEQRSPAASESSQFTSVSQRGVNPNWLPPSGLAQRPSPGPSRNDMVLNANPDFTLPAAGPGRGGRGGYRGGRAIGPLRNGPSPPTMGMGGPMPRGPMPPVGAPGVQYQGAY